MKKFLATYMCVLMLGFTAWHHSTQVSSQYADFGSFSADISAYFGDFPDYYEEEFGRDFGSCCTEYDFSGENQEGKLVPI